jgi:hypothetical protein
MAARHVDEKVQVELASLQVSVGNGCNAKENDARDACDALPQKKKKGRRGGLANGDSAPCTLEVPMTAGPLRRRAPAPHSRAGAPPQ